MLSSGDSVIVARYCRVLCCLAVLAVAAHARAEDAPEPSPPHQYNLRTWAMSWSWNQGLHYGIDVPDVEESWKERELRWRPWVRGDFGIRLSIDAAGVRESGSFVDLDDNVQVRRSYLYVDGALASAWKPLTYKFEIGAVGSEFSLRNASLSIHDIPYAGTFTFGSFDTPMSLSYLTSSRATPLMERAAVVDAMAPGTKSGAMFSNWLQPKRLTWALGLFSAGSDNDVGDQSNAPVRVAGRTTWLPWRNDAHEFLHVGLGASWAFSPGADIRFRAQPESFLAPDVVDTGDMDGRQVAVIGPEVLLMRNRLSLQGEYLQAKVVRDGAASPLFGGLYLMASFFLTPDARNYDQQSAAFTSLVPNRPLSWKARQLGAFEVAARYSFLDLSDAGVRGGQVNELMSGLNWYWNRYVRMQFNVGWATVASGPRPGDYAILQTRIDLMI